MSLSLSDRAAAYLSRLPASVSGCNGHTALFNAARVLAKGFALSFDEALRLLREWSALNASPPWSEADLIHKLKDAFRLPGPSGYLTGTGGGSNDFAGGGGIADDEARRKEELRNSWPAFRKLSDSTMREIAELRNVPLASVFALHAAGYLRGAVYDSHRCFILTEGRFAQARRLDAEPLSTRSGTPIKAKNLPGSEGAFLGRKWVRESTGPILLCEGVVSLLEGAGAAYLAEADAAGWTVLAAVSAGSRFDDELLHALQGRRVRIFPDNDDSGLSAAAKWTAALRTVNAAVDCVRPPSGCKDLGDLLKDPERHRAALARIFTL